MRLIQSRRELGFAGVLILCCAVLVGGSYWLLDNTIRELVLRDAERTALDWGLYLADSLQDVETIAGSGYLDDENESLIHRVTQGGPVFRLKLFDKTGRLLLMSSRGKGVIRNGVAERDPIATAVAASGEPHTAIMNGTAPGEPSLYEKAYLPIVRGGTAIAILKVDIDESGKQALFRESFVSAMTALLWLIALSFAVPAIGLLWSRHKWLAADERLVFMAHHDAMTGLINRGKFLTELERLLADAEGTPGTLAVCYIDMDRLKEINDTLGHDVGDAVIMWSAERLRTLAGPDDLCARLGGDEFMIAHRLPDEDGAEAAFAATLLDSFSQPIRTRGHDVKTSFSIGLALAPRDGTSAGALITKADIALYRAKAEGRNTYRIYQPCMDAELDERRHIETLLRHALAEDGFRIHFQPLYDTSGSELVGFEALLRLQDEDGFMIPPVRFIPVAENMGLISKIGRWVLHHACAVAATWPDSLNVAVNLSAVQFADGSVCDSVRSALEDSGLAPERLELEITESLLMSDSDVVLRALHQLKDMGVSVVMDDFGTGYSSLSYLWKFPFDKIKIDRSFMEALKSDTSDDSNVGDILRTIISLGHCLSMRVTAEGIEREDQLELLRTLTCDELQGFYFSRPVPEEEVAATILRDFQNRIGDKPVVDSPSAERGADDGDAAAG